MTPDPAQTMHDVLPLLNPTAELRSTGSHPHILQNPATFSPSTFPAPSETTLYHNSSAQASTKSLRQKEGEWNIPAALTHTGQTENYFTLANASPLIPTQKNSEKELTPFLSSSVAPPVFGTEFSTQNKTLNPENSLALIPKVENTPNCFDNFQLADWHEVKCQICKDESLDLLAMPVIFGQQPGMPRTWAPIPSHEIKEFLKAIKDSDICSPYFKQLLKGTLEGHTLTPNDCKNLASITLTDSQYMLWELKWKRMLTEILATLKVLMQISTPSPYPN